MPRLRALAQAIGVPGNRISGIVRGRRDASADTAIRLGGYYGVDPRFWMDLQTAYDLSRAEAEHDYSAVRPRTERAA
jgi:antitoxin HigA-1